MTYSDSILVTDFDGTVSKEDFFIIAVRRLLGSDDLRPWADFRAGRLSHFEAIRAIFSRIRAPEALIDEILRDMQPDPDMALRVRQLKDAGWGVVVASAGCEWYVRRIFERLGVEVEIHANPGYYAEGGPLVMERNTASPFYCPELGVDKAAIVRFHLERGARVAYCGDGVTDEPAALLAPPRLRFARRDLARALEAGKHAYRPFEIWSEVALEILGMPEAPGTRDTA